MKTEKMDVSLKFTTQVLGSTPKNKEVYAAYIKTKAPDQEKGEEELETVKDIEEKGWTGFHSDENGLFMYDYVVRGFLKESASALKSTHAIKAFKSKIDRLVFVFPRKLYFLGWNGKMIKESSEVFERPLRAMTMQGPRVTVARSDILPEGTRLNFSISIFPNNEGVNQEWIKGLLEYGRFQGLGQFRNGSFGRFEVE